MLSPPRLCAALLSCSEDSEKLVTVARLECRGLVPAEFAAGDCWVAKAPGHTWSDVDLGEDWMEVDDAGASSSVMDVRTGVEVDRGAKGGKGR
jgi:hypothetical protein